MGFNIDRLGGEPVQDDFVPSNGQTVFILSQTPTDPNDVYAIINHVTYTPPAFFTVSGTTVTWFNVFVLDSTDNVRFVYFA